jgi:hypothetical protein
VANLVRDQGVEERKTVQKRREGSQNYDEKGDRAQKPASRRRPGDGKMESVSKLIEGCRALRERKTACV